VKKKACRVGAEKKRKKRGFRGKILRKKKRNALIGQKKKKPKGKRALW